MEITVMKYGHPLWEKTIEFAENCSWRAGAFLANMMRGNEFSDIERVLVACEGDEIAGVRLTDGDSHIRSSFGRGSYRGDVTVASPRQSCVVLTRMDSIYVNGYRVGADGTTELKDTERAAMWNEKAQTDSGHLGLTQAQYESNIFRTEAQNG